MAATIRRFPLRDSRVFEVQYREACRLGKTSDAEDLLFNGARAVLAEHGEARLIELLSRLRAALRATTRRKAGRVMAKGRPCG